MSELRSRVWYRVKHGYWCYRIYLAEGGALGGYGYATWEEARAALAEHLGRAADISL